jgi:hypothetical protein
MAVTSSACRKTIEGKQHPARDAQSRYIYEQVKATNAADSGTGRRPVLALSR